MYRPIAIAFLTVATVLATACAPTGGPGSSDATATAMKTPVAKPGLSPQQRLRRALELLEDGDEATARVELVAYMEKYPMGGTGQDLLRQIDTPAEDYYPAQYREVTLEAGQSLSNIAKTYLGSVYEFHALAKYNNIDRPKRLVAGKVVKVPLTTSAVAAFMVLDGKAEKPPVDDTPVAEQLDADVDVLQEGSVGDAVDEATEIQADGVVGDAEAMDISAEVETIAEQIIDKDDLHRQAINAYRAQDLTKAIGLWDQILAVDPDYENARLYRSQAIELEKRLKSLK